MDNRSETRDFLTSRRARISPEQAGLPTFGGHRRVPGLRREEAALLAGVSIGYYTRVERGNLSIQQLLDAMTGAPASVFGSPPTPPQRARCLPTVSPCWPAGPQRSTPPTIRPTSTPCDDDSKSVVRAYDSLMTSRRMLSVCLAALVPIIVGCGTTTGGTAQPVGQDSSGTSDQLGAGPTSKGGSSRAGSIDVCALLSEADADAVARAHKLNGAQTAATKYTLTKTKVENNPDAIVPTSGCKFTIEGDGASGTVEMDVLPADQITIYQGGKRVPGLGDEAYSGIGQTVVRVGDLMLLTGEDSFTEDFAVDLYRKMIPNMK